MTSRARRQAVVGLGLALVLALSASAQTSPQLSEILSRVSEEADAFLRISNQTLAEETLTQRAVKALPRFRPRIGTSAVRPPQPKLQTREIVSEYSYAWFHESGDALHELRQVLTVDGRKVNTSVKARNALYLGVKSRDEQLKKRMLEDYEKHGLIGAVTDLGPLLLLFSRRELEKYEFSVAGEGRIGADRALRISYRTRGQEPLTVFRARQAVHQGLTGEIWVRQPDYLPLRITMKAARKEGKAVIREEATVEYAFSAHGFLTPASAVHREFVDDALVVENQFRYTPFRKFSADAEIKFEVEPEPEKK